MMKKLLMLVLVLCLLTGCSGKLSPQETETAMPEAAATYSMSSPKAPEETAAASKEPAEVSLSEILPAEELLPAASEPPAAPPEESETPALDQYRTEPVPEGKPAPVEPQDVTAGETAFTCTLSVRCDTILDNKGDLDPEKLELVPEDGIIFAARTVTFYEGESVFNILQREMKRAKIHMEFRNTPIYNSAYILGINNLYEFDCGELSGWMYKVNDWFPNYGCSRYQLKDGDIVEWIYTCDLGRDIGGESAVAG